MEKFRKEAKIGKYRVSYIQKGRGKALVLLHSLLNTAFSFRHVYSTLSEQYKLILPDLLGCGLSSKPDDFDFKIESMAAYLKKLLEHLKIDKCALGGVSAGGAIALKMVVDFPELVDKLILIDALGLPLGEQGRPRGLPVRGNVNNKDIFLTLYLSRFHNPKVVSEEERVKIAELAVAKSVPQCTQKILQANGSFAVEGIDKIEVPTLVIWGERDPVLPKSLAENFVHIIPNSRYVMIPEAGHLPHEESPEDFNTVLLDFLKGDIPKAG